MAKVIAASPFSPPPPGAPARNGRPARPAGRSRARSSGAAATRAHRRRDILAIIRRAKDLIKSGERPVLIVALCDADLLAALRGKVASWWTPDEIIRVVAMPLAGTGKIDKLRLRAQYATPPAA